MAALKTADAADAEACLGRVEENLRLVERGRLTAPDGADLGMFLLSDGTLERPVGVARVVYLAEMRLAELSPDGDTLSGN